MTQKELLYVEDAICHEQIIVKVLEDTINQLEDEDLVAYIVKEKKTHENMEKKLKKLLEEVKNG